ncbi:MAG: L-threonylcarbamoyladenylate synthase [Rhodothermia bacterium]|nr:L-threonylcarbamoyladenylate synthase [Rhodothermia bacterium]
MQFLKEAVITVCNGGVLIYPTETVYGIGGDAHREEVIARVQKIKGRDAQKPMLVLTDVWERALPWIAEQTPIHQALMDTDLPLTILFKPTNRVPDRLRALSALIGIRKTTHPFCQKLIRNTDSLLLSTSANPSGSPATHNLSQLASDFLAQVDLTVDFGILPAQLPSSVVMVEGGKIRLIREGAIGIAILHRLLGVE